MKSIVGAPLKKVVINLGTTWFVRHRMEQRKSLVCFLCICMIICLITKTSACCDSLTPNVSITLVNNDKGAACLDGSPPSYYHDMGEGQGINNWMIFLQGGGWCSTIEECKDHTKNHLGSSKFLARSILFGNILSKSSETNPDFCSWNRVFINYCDGSSFTGNVDTVDPATNLTYRGGRIFTVIMEDLLKKGMKNAKNAILSGSSAGGLAAILHCDRFRSLLPDAAKVKCFSDSAYFLHEKYLMGEKKFDSVFEGLIALHGSSQMLPSSCTEKFIKPSLCFFPQYILPNVMTPLFLTMSSFDEVQVMFNLSPMHVVCLLYQNCTLVEMNEIEGLRLELLHALPMGNPSFRGIWVTSCITHDLIELSWTSPKSKTIDGKAYPEIFGDWFYDRCAVDTIDISIEAKNCTNIGINIMSF